MKPTHAVLGAWLALAATAQQDPAAKAAAAGEKWLATDHTSADLLEQTVTALLVDQTAGLAWLGKQLPGSLAAPAEPRSKGVQALATHTSLEVLRRTATSGVVFAGQYDPLKPLQPFVGGLFFDLLLDTPDWYPDTHRVQLVPALRDLQPLLPPAARIERLIALAEDQDEPDELRLQVGCMLWQWGKKQFVQPQIDKLQKDAAEGDAEDRVRTLLELADLQYQLRDYKAGAATHRTLQALAATARVPLKPNDWYSAACMNALCGNVERGLEALQACAELQASPNVDSSHKLKRELWEKDPEIAVLRRDGRYAAIFAKAFPAKGPDEPRGR